MYALQSTAGCASCAAPRRLQLPCAAHLAPPVSVCPPALGVPRRVRAVGRPPGALPDEKGPAQAAADDDDVTFQPARKARVKGRVQAKVKVSTPAVDAALDAPPTEAGRAETSALLALSAGFVAILVEGLLVASSGFMSDEWDGIVQARRRAYAARVHTVQAH